MKEIGIYLSGSITHDPDFERKFALAERIIRAEAVPEALIFNPAANQNLPAEGKTDEELWADYLVRDLFMLMTIRNRFRDALLVSLPGRQASKGASLERAFASRIGFRLMDIREIFPDWEKRLAAEKENCGSCRHGKVYDGSCRASVVCPFRQKDGRLEPMFCALGDETMLEALRHPETPCPQFGPKGVQP